MDRLNCLRCEYRHQDNGNCTAVGGFCTAVPTVHCKKLKEYMDTGSTPEEIEELKVIKWWSQCGTDDIMPTVFGVPVNRLRELAAADRDSRVVVLPCKVGDTVWQLYKGEYPYPHRVDAIDGENLLEIQEDNEWNLGMFYMGRRIYKIRISEFGKTVFLTEAEAEAALKEQEEK